jgi:transcriptional regulator with XRE-family HTH domain
VAVRRRRRDLAIDRGRQVAARSGAEIRMAREGAGVSLRDAAVAVGLGYRTFARIERAELRAVTVEQLCLACAAVGLEFNGRPYPWGDPIRDAAHVRLLGRLRACLPEGSPWRLELPVAIPGDMRAVDAVTRLRGTLIGIEAETRIRDVQALVRRALLKKRDAGLDVLVLLVADTRANRRVLELHREDLRADFPLDAREILRVLRHGEPPSAGGIVVL